MIAKMNVRCIDEKLCEDCPELDLEINKIEMNDGSDTIKFTINNIACKHYNVCSRMLRFLNENKDDIKYIGRDGD